MFDSKRWYCVHMNRKLDLKLFPLWLLTRWYIGCPKNLCKHHKLFKIIGLDVFFFLFVVDFPSNLIKINTYRLIKN